MIAGWLMTAMLFGVAPADARIARATGLTAGPPHHGHPINAWRGNRRLHLR